MPDRSPTNSFVRELLSLQQDGDGSISAPVNWCRPPLLAVRTEVDEVVDDLAPSMLRIGGNTVARWHFFIGSPGNGKSAAVGRLCTVLSGDKGCSVADQEGADIASLDPRAMPYLLTVSEGANRFPSAWLVQDASVVPNPFASDVDPARDLVTAMADAWERGISLVVCTNRGVLEKAHADAHTRRDQNTTAWFRVLAGLVVAPNQIRGELDAARDFYGRNRVFEKVRITYTCLDNRSLLLGNDTFDRLVQNAVEGSRWTQCTSCEAAGMCPFKANREWLATERGRSRVLELLRRGEALSGQIIVFREAVALVSLFLAGCPRDYDGETPCDWVRGRIAAGDLFAIATRRIHMSLFAASSPYGLCSSPALRQRQVSGLREIERLLGDDPDVRPAKRALTRVLSGPAPSGDVGVVRLLASGGTLTLLDPLREALPLEFYERWDGDFRAISSEQDPLLSELDLACARVWSVMGEAIESGGTSLAPEALWSLRRWASNYLLHLGALLEGLTAWARELTDFLGVLEPMAKPPEERSTEERRRIHVVSEELERLLVPDRARLDGAECVALSESVMLGGRWVAQHLRPRIVPGEKPGSLSLAVEFGDPTGGMARVALGASMYVWLRRASQGHLDYRCLPPGLRGGAMDARIRAAGTAAYAFADNDVVLRVSADKFGELRLTRFDGDVLVEQVS